MKISAVIPCYNEAESIGSVLASLPKELHEVIVVDNRCTDDTAAIATAAGARVVREERAGYGWALRAGFAAATGDVIVTLDGDGQYPPDAILPTAALLDAKRLDFISCNRFPLQNKQSLSFTRRFGNFFLTLAGNFFFGIDLKDSQSGMWVFRTSVLKKITLTSGDMPLSEEIKIRAAHHPQIRFAEFPITYHPRIGESKLFPLKHGFMNLWFFVRLRFLFWRSSPEALQATLAFIAIAVLYLALSFWNIGIPFTGVTSDVNGENGIAAVNFLRWGIFDLRFGLFTSWLTDPASAFGNFYTHHPLFFLVPTYLFYLLFGVSETTTRLGPLSVTFLGISFFFFGLRTIFANWRLPFLICLGIILLPGTIYYGKTFELAVFSMPMMLITFSLFLFYRQRPSFLKFLFVLASIVVGGMMGWFYYFLPIALWLYIFLSRRYRFESLPRAESFLIAIPALLVFNFAATIFHFYLLNGSQIFSGLYEAFLYRTSRAPVDAWLGRIFSLASLNFTTVFSITAFVGFLIFLFTWRSIPMRERILIVLPAAAIFNALVFYQWTTHPFGLTFFIPSVGVFCAVLYRFLFNHFRLAGGIIAICLIAAGSYYSYSNLDYFYHQFLILGPKDIELIKALPSQVKPDEPICIGPQQIGINFHGIIDWYVHRATLGPLDNVADCPAGPATAILFSPSLGEFYQKQADQYLAEGRFTAVGCGDLLCVVHRQ